MGPLNKSNWPKLRESLNTIDWPKTFCETPLNLYLDVAIDTISENVLSLSLCVPQKQSKKSKVSRFYHERKIIMRNRLKLVKSSKPAPYII